MANSFSPEKHIEEIVSVIPFNALKQAAEELSATYRIQSNGIKSNKFMRDYKHKLAYLALRMPATFAAVNEVIKHIPSSINSCLDVGAGPGTAFLAIQNRFPELKENTLLEKDSDFINIGRKLCPQSSYQQGNIEAYICNRSYDLVIAAYSLSELSEKNLNAVLDALWKSAAKFFCIIEPGTPYGFKTILHARKYLLEQKAHILAPCTHHAACPMENVKDWCHFSVRLDRTNLQKRVKEGSLGYEDEKYSYLIFSKEPIQKSGSRIMKSPEKRSGFIRFDLCNSNGLNQKIYSKRDGDKYQNVKKLDWGDYLLE